MVGLGTVGRWLLEALATHTEPLGRAVSVVAIANRREGVLHEPAGIDPGAALDALDTGTPISALGQPGDLSEIDMDILVEVTQSPACDGEPGYTHMRTALEHGVSVVTSNKWPVALHGVELAEIARRNGAAFRVESTVMSGTPVMTALTDGIAGASPVRLRGVLNATVNQICTRIDEGVAYADALGDAQAMGLAEPDPSEDVDGFDSVAKLMILSGLVFGDQLALKDVARSGISGLGADVAERDPRTRLREVATLDPGSDLRSVEMIRLEPGDPLYAVEGSDNAVVLDAEPIGEVLIRGPGAGPKLAGQGVLSDLIALSRRT